MASAGLRRAWRVALSMLAPVLACIPVHAARASDPAIDLFPRAAAGYIVAINGKPRWARAPDSPRAPASLTKVLTALVLPSIYPLFADRPREVEV